MRPCLEKYFFLTSTFEFISPRLKIWQVISALFSQFYASLHPWNSAPSLHSLFIWPKPWHFYYWKYFYFIKNTRHGGDFADNPWAGSLLVFFWAGCFCWVAHGGLGIGAGSLLAATPGALAQAGDRARCHLALPRLLLSHGSPPKLTPSFPD